MFVRTFPNICIGKYFSNYQSSSEYHILNGCTLTSFKGLFQPFALIKSLFMTVWFRYSTNVEDPDQPELDDRSRAGSPVISAAMLQFYLIN